jgi:hypothetical protein
MLKRIGLSVAALVAAFSLMQTPVSAQERNFSRQSFNSGMNQRNGAFRRDTRVQYVRGDRDEHDRVRSDRGERERDRNYRENNERGWNSNAWYR